MIEFDAHFTVSVFNQAAVETVLFCSHSWLIYFKMLKKKTLCCMLKIHGRIHGFAPKVNQVFDWMTPIFYPSFFENCSAVFV